MVRGAPLMVGAALLAVVADAFVAPGPARLATPTWVSAKPLIDASPKARVPMRAGLQTGLRMGSKGGEVNEFAFSPNKRSWLWKYSESVLDKVLLILQALVVSVYRRVVYKVLYKLHIVEDPDELSSIRPDVLTDPRLRASWNKEGSSSGVFTKQSPQKFRIGTVQEEPNAYDAPTLNLRTMISFALVSLPVIFQFIALVTDDKYNDAVASAVTSLSLLTVGTDLLAGSPSGLTVRIRRALPVEIRKLLVTAKMTPVGPSDVGRKSLPDSTAVPMSSPPMVRGPGQGGIGSVMA